MRSFLAAMAVLLVMLASCQQEDWWLQGREEIVPEPERIRENLPVSTGLPVMIINTENKIAITDKVNWIKAEVRILDKDGYVTLPTRSCRMRGRGNSTWSWSKKPYSLQLDTLAHVLGMPAQKHWVLLANYMDRTLMRDALGFHVGRHTSLPWTPRCEYVELVLNGKHVGNYLVAEQVRPDSDRVAIPKNTKGTFLFESDFHYDEPWQWKERDIPFCVKSPEEDVMTEALFAEAKSFIKTKLNACWSGSYETAAAALDLQSFADYWICFEVMGNHELGNPGSVFTYTAAAGKWMAGPVWDFDWGGLSYKTSPHAKTGLVNRNAVWYGGLHGIKEYRHLLAERWKALKPELEKCASFIDETREYLRESDKLNRAMWNPAGAGNINGDEQLSFDEATERLKTIFLERIKVMDSIIADGEF